MQKQSIPELLKTTGLNKTKIRVEMLRIFHSARVPMDVHEVKNKLQHTKITADDVTIYRTVNRFVEVGILEDVHFNDGKSRYELTSRNHHHHVICRTCGSVEELEDTKDCTVGELEHRIKSKHKYSGITHSLEFFGICPSCTKRY